ncbi:WD repeat-containing protein [Dirofilaria immitis]
MKLSNNRSVMPLDVQGCTRATLEESACCNHYRKILDSWSTLLKQLYSVKRMIRGIMGRNVYNLFSNFQ